MATTLVASQVMRRLPCLINGQWVRPLGETFTPQANPNNGLALPYAVHDASPEQVDAAVAAAASGEPSRQWRRMTVDDRYTVLLKTLTRIDDTLAEELALTDAVETGVHVSVTRNISEGFVPCATDVLGKVKTFLEAENRKSLEGRHGHPIRCARVPLTPVAIIAPWNVPCGTILPKLFAALLCGCSVIVKPSERASTSISKLVGAMVADGGEAEGVGGQHDGLPATSTNGAGIPAGVLQLITGGKLAGELLVSNPKIAAVQFTGAGSTAAVIRSELSKKLRPFLAECGGSNAIIVTEEANLEHAAAAVVQGVTALNGQWCMGISRIFVAASRAEEFVKVLEFSFRRRVVLAASDTAVEELVACMHAENAKEDALAEAALEAVLNGDGRVVPTTATNTSAATMGNAALSSSLNNTMSASINHDDAITTKMCFSPTLRRQPTTSSIVSGINEELSIVGPMAFKDGADRLRATIARGWRGKKSSGGGDEDEEPNGKVILLGRRYTNGGESTTSSCFLQPHLIVGGDLDYLSQAELFGPAVALFPFNTIDEAVEMANKADGQLCCYFFTGEEQHTLDKAYDEHCTMIHSGMIMINSIGFGFEVADGLEEPMGDFVGMAGSGADGNPEALARFFTSTRWFGVNGTRSVAHSMRE